MQRAPSQSLPGKLQVRSGNQKSRKSTLGLNISPPQRPPFTYTFHFVHVGWSHRPNNPCQVSSPSVQQFRLPRGSKFTISHRLGESRLLQQCYALTCYTVIRVVGLSVTKILIGGPWTNYIKGPIPHFEFTEEFIIIKVLAKVTIKHKTMMKCEVKSNFIIKVKLSVS